MLKRKFGLIIFGLTMASLAHSASAGFDLQSQVKNYRERYALKNPYEKLINNTGDGFEPLYGVKNLRVVLHGIFYRGGANNAYHRTAKRANMNPLPNDGLKHLCEEGFKEVVYLYTTNYSTAPKATNCQNSSGEKNQINYFQITALDQQNDAIHLRKIYDHIKGKVTGPIYEHCWNGWHASGFVSALALKQFCGYTNTQADDYWVKNTDGHSKGYESIRAKIKAFQPIQELAISSEEKSLICP